LIEGQEAKARELAGKEARRPFDLSTGPVLRTSLLRLSDEEHILLLTMHHIVSDGWSLGIMIREVVTLYNAFAHGMPSPLPELPVQYADFAVWQREWLQGEVLEEQLCYWKQQLAGAAPLQLPLDFGRPSLAAFRGGHKSLTISEESTRRLRELGRQESVTLFMTLLAAFQTLLYRYTGQTDISVGSPIANRNRAEIEGLIGFFVNTLVLRTRLNGERSFRELLREVREITLRAYDYQDVPFERLVEELQPERSLSHTPLFDVMFVLQNAPLESKELADIQIKPFDFEEKTAKFDLTLSMFEAGDRIGGSLEYNADLFKQSTIERMVNHFSRLLVAIVENPATPLNQLDMLSEQETNLLLKETGVKELDESFSF
jgi:hypothetical protein